MLLTIAFAAATACLVRENMRCRKQRHAADAALTLWAKQYAAYLKESIEAEAGGMILPEGKTVLVRADTRAAEHRFIQLLAALCGKGDVLRHGDFPIVIELSWRTNSLMCVLRVDGVLRISSPAFAATDSIRKAVLEYISGE